MAEAVTVRAARAEDLPAVRQLLADAHLPLDGLEEQFGDRYAVAVTQGQIVAAEGVEVYERWGLLRSAVVAPAHRGIGLGIRLTKERVGWARRQQLEALYLLTTTAAPFFARLGFEEVTRAAAPAAVQASPEFATACPASATCMRLALDPP
jgi:N-acetylglutamate synthase-like GNAT family acetyltransferase